MPSLPLCRRRFPENDESAAEAKLTTRPDGGPALSQNQWATLVEGWLPGLVDRSIRQSNCPEIEVHHERIKGWLGAGNHRYHPPPLAGRPRPRPPPSRPCAATSPPASTRRSPPTRCGCCGSGLKFNPRRGRGSTEGGATPFSELAYRWGLYARAPLPIIGYHDHSIRFKSLTGHAGRSSTSIASLLLDLLRVGSFGSMFTPVPHCLLHQGPRAETWHMKTQERRSSTVRESSPRTGTG